MQIDVIETPDGNRFRWRYQSYFDLEHEVTSNILMAPSRGTQEGIVVRDTEGEIVDRGFVQEGRFQGKNSLRFSNGPQLVTAAQFTAGWTIEVIPRQVKGYDVHEHFERHYGTALFGLEPFGIAYFYRKLEEAGRRP